MLETEYMALMGYDTDDLNEEFTYEFTEANETYMACSDSMDKVKFCDDWKKHKDPIIITDLSAKCQGLTHKVKELRNIIRDGVDELVDVLSDLQNTTPGTDTIRELQDRIDGILFTITDRRTIVKAKLNKDVDLNENDLVYIEQNLK